MKITDKEIKWLELYFPNLRYEANSQTIVGELDFCAAYDKESGKLIINDGLRKVNRLIGDVFEIKICLGILDGNGWPKVYEVGERYRQISKKCNVKIIDLHFHSDDNACCLGLKFRDSRRLNIRSFLEELVIPFFYQLSYTEKFGIAASRNDLWGEYSHGEKGQLEYITEISNFANQNPSRNAPCPCGSGKKYKKCHIDDMESLKRIQKGTMRT